MKKKVLFPVLLAALAFPLCLHNNPISVNAEFIGEFGSRGSQDRTDYIAHASKVNAQLADEGFVLLKNDGFLPVDTSDEDNPPKVTLVGKASCKLIKGGEGSGAGSTSSGVTDYDLTSISCADPSRIL